MSETFKQTEPHVSRMPIYTVGYGGRSVENLLDLLHKYEIEFLIDIRSQPYSRFNPQFSGNTLETFLKRHHLRYVFMGDTLGGRPSDDACYTDGKVDYAKVREKDFYQQGIKRLQIVWEKQIAVVLMCAEIKPQECHRSKLIGNTLCDHHIDVAHIDEGGTLKTQELINQILVGHQLGQQLSLFDEDDVPVSPNKKINFSRKKYLPNKEE
jgi:uncharacterized protein (DUF488 family)